MLIGFGCLLPLLAWLSPLGFAPTLAFMGLLSLPALRARRADRPVLVIVLAGSVWFSASILWSPFRPDELEDATALKVLAAVPLFAGAICAARAAAPELLRRALLIAVIGLTAYGVLLTIEGLSGAAIYQWVRASTGDPIRPDLAARNVARGAFVLSVLAAPAAAAGWRLGLGFGPALAMAAGIIAAELGFDSDAPVLALLSASAAAGAFALAPRLAPRLMGLAALVVVLATPGVIWGLQAAGLYDGLMQAAPLSWAERMGYWSHAAARIAAHPLIGWGLDASRTMSPDIILHPHNGPLQLWLELGVVGAALAAALWAMLFRKASRERADLSGAAMAGAAAAYFSIAAVGFGVWQDWWLALGVAACVLCTALDRLSPAASAAPRSSPDTD
ncbi:O-antigen ligase family protein [Phenylobacterium sp.]|uniref:O-antigen ligase family protein n=1 Tax=Phenylobacterium sp. TaxID=1871053 RepID=UPI002735312D|nr:O-antigen ligase family protein [Phenylobacterium sp.]MDP3660607.1 O-antigen ligase family protein [Phenylobacterium sp.]